MLAEDKIAERQSVSLPQFFFYHQPFLNLCTAQGKLRRCQKEHLHPARERKLGTLCTLCRTYNGEKLLQISE